MANKLIFDNYPLPQVFRDMAMKSSYAIEKYTGLEFQKPNQFIFIKDGRYMPSKNLVIVDLTHSNDRREFCHIITHEMLHKIGYENHKPWYADHDHIFSMEQRICNILLDREDVLFPKRR